MQEETETKQISKLNDEWNLYYHLPDDKQWDISSYKYIIMQNINTLEELISINEKIPEKIVKKLYVICNEKRYYSHVGR